VYRLAELSSRIIDQAVAQGVPFAREYGGHLATRSFGGALVSRTFYARGQTGQQLLLGAYQALSKEVAAASVTVLPRREMLDLIVVDGRARGVVARDLVSGALEVHAGDAVVLATGGYANVYFLSTNAKASNATAIWRAYRRGAAFANPGFVQFHPTALPAAGEHQAKLTLMSESLRNDARLWVPRRAGDDRRPEAIPEPERDYFLERRYPRYGNLVPRDLGSRAAKTVADEGHGVGPGGRAVYLDLRDAAARVGAGVLRERYGNLFKLYQHITGDDALQVPMRVAPAAHYTMGGLWVDYDLMSNLPGLFVIGEANFSDHGANRLGASALMQGLADGYFVLPATMGNYLAPLLGTKPVPTDAPAFLAAEQQARERFDGYLAIKGTRSVDWFHRELGRIMWEFCGMERTAEGLEKALGEIPTLHAEFRKDLRVPGGPGVNQSLEKAGRVDDFFELATLMCRDALDRNESCGGHFRAEYQTEDGEARRDDEHYAYAAAWVWTGDPVTPVLHKEPLEFENVHLAVRSYK
jgi:succinate dehydrogenase / fumarate reductase flavoprotein subunit